MKKSATLIFFTFFFNTNQSYSRSLSLDEAETLYEAAQTDYENAYLAMDREEENNFTIDRSWIDQEDTDENALNKVIRYTAEEKEELRAAILNIVKDCNAKLERTQKLMREVKDTDVLEILSKTHSLYRLCTRQAEQETMAQS